MDNLPESHNRHPEDFDHVSMDMTYVEVFLRNYGRLELAAQRFSETLAPPDWQGFARTFVRNTEGSNFQHDAAGAGELPPYVASSRCEGLANNDAGGRDGLPGVPRRVASYRRRRAILT